MAKFLKVACIQLTSKQSIQENLKQTIKFVHQAISKKAKLIITPEITNIVSSNKHQLLEEIYLEGNDPFLKTFKTIAREKTVWIVLGSIIIRNQNGKIYNRSYVINDQGKLSAKYDKIHLFDAKISKKEKYRESSLFLKGKKIKVVKTPWGKIGLSICFDIRFPELYRHLMVKGAQFITIPAAFTVKTGRAHWQNLIVARAIETGCYIFAPAQYGKHNSKRITYGHSLIVSPWGDIIAERKSGQGLIMADIDPNMVNKIRQNIASFKPILLK